MEVVTFLWAVKSVAFGGNVLQQLPAFWQGAGDEEIVTVVMKHFS